MLEWSIEQMNVPVAIRVPWNGVYHTDDVVKADFSEVKYKISKKGSKVAIML